MKDKIVEILSLLADAKILISELEEEVIKIRDVSDERFEMPISSLKLSKRTLYCLNYLGVTTVGELVRYSEWELMKLRNFGKRSLQEVVEKLSKIGLKLEDGLFLRQQKIDEILSNAKR